MDPWPLSKVRLFTPESRHHTPLTLPFGRYSWIHRDVYIYNPCNYIIHRDIYIYIYIMRYIKALSHPRKSKEGTCHAHHAHHVARVTRVTCVIRHSPAPQNYELRHFFTDILTPVLRRALKLILKDFSAFFRQWFLCQ